MSHVISVSLQRIYLPTRLYMIGMYWVCCDTHTHTHTQYIMNIMNMEDII